ncbi:putative RNA-directed DNA polymerase [Helianthus annuus]|nr:putative RNA-directed DNA polymerase [Helianthus annuus]
MMVCFCCWVFSPIMFFNVCLLYMYVHECFFILFMGFLLANLKAMNFPVQWRKWIGACLKSSWASVLVNGSPTSEFNLQRGLRQGDPLSPFLFILAMQALDVIMTRANERNIFQGIKLPNEGPCISHLCYADDVIFMGEWSETNIVNLNRILRCFYMTSGLKVNLRKSSLYGVGVEDEEITRMATKLKCRKGDMPFGFLGLTIGANMKREKYWKPVIDKFNKKLSAWKAKCLSFAGRLVLAKAVMGALPNYYLSMYIAPKKVIQKLETIRRKFVWGSKEGKNKICWIAWKTMIRPRKYGGFGMGDLRNANLALLTKWGWKYKARQEALWATVVKAIHENKRSHKYLPLNKGVAGVWKDILASFEELNNKGINVRERLIAKIGDGKTVKIWLDSWTGGLPFNERYPDLFKIVKNKQSTVAECATKVGNEIQWNFQWNRPPISDAEWNQWSEMLNVLNKVKIETRPDRWGWKNQDWEIFTVAAVKELIEKQADSEQNEQWSHWNTWVPAKINYFVWRASLGRIAVKQELKKRDIILNSDLCSRCGRWEESVVHLISECITSKEAWRYIIEWLKLPTDADVSSCKRIMEYP